MGFYENPNDAINGPIYDDEGWETVYTTPDAPESLNEESASLNKEYDPMVVDLDDDEETASALERLLWINEVLNEGVLAGEGDGVEVAGVVATVLSSSRKYGFRFEFWELPKGEPKPPSL